MDTYINLRHLAAFVKVYELGTLVEAARAVNITQPAITQGLAGLEQAVDCKLFDRRSDGMQPTENAHALYFRAVSSLKHISSNRVTYTQLRAFIALATWGSYTSASAATGLARPSLKRAANDLQIALGKTLIERDGRGIKLTSFGKRTARRFRLAIKEIENGLEEIAGLKGDQTGKIAIGAMPLSRAKVLPKAIVEFKAQNPAAHVLVAEGSYFELIEPLRNGELDFLIGALRDPSPGPDLVQTELFVDLPVIIARAAHPLKTTRRRIDLKKLTTFEWCVPKKGVPLRESWEAMFIDRGLTVPPVSVECGSVMAIRQILLGTDCLTLLSADQLAVELEAGWLKVIGQAPSSMQRKIGLTHREGWHPTSLQSAFVETLNSISAGSQR